MSEEKHHAGCCGGEHPHVESGSQDAVSQSRRKFLMQTTGAAGAFTAAAAGLPYITTAQAEGLNGSREVGTRKHHYLPATKNTVHWGFFSKNLPAIVEADSGDFVTLETVTHHPYDDYERMIKGDPGVEGIFHWDSENKGVDRRASDGCVIARTRSRGGAGCTHHYRTGLRQWSGTW